MGKPVPLESAVWTPAEWNPDLFLFLVKQANSIYGACEFLSLSSWRFFGDRWSNRKHFPRNLSSVALQGDRQPSLYKRGQVREQTDPNSSEPRCPSVLSRTQSWVQKAIHGIGCHRVSYPCGDAHPWWPGTSSWPPTQKRPQSLPGGCKPLTRNPEHFLS